MLDQNGLKTLTFSQPVCWEYRFHFHFYNLWLVFQNEKQLSGTDSESLEQKVLEI